jgi:hypothetical protein|tara:strand:+ start:2804 stop:3241 length:438 start_codon:yes stop_codon:yes gene_type:complete
VEELGAGVLLQFTTALSPFLLITSCATLVWALQTRYSRVVQTIRAMSAHLGSEDEATQQKHFGQLEFLQRRAWMLRNSVAGHYLAMLCFLLSIGFFTATILTPFSFLMGTVISFVSGMLLICIALLNSAFEASRSLYAIKDEIRE